MPHRDITLTPETTDILSKMGAEQYANFIDFISNPAIRQAADNGEELQWWGTTSSYSAWVEIACDQNANVSMQLWETKPDGRVKKTDPVYARLATPLATTSNAWADLEFRRMQGTIRKMACAMRSAGERLDFPLVARMAASLGKHVPWVEKILTLAHRVHSSAAGPHLYTAIKRMGLIGELVDEDLVYVAASPCTTVQALLAVHASVHHVSFSEEIVSEPELYALESEGNPTMYMFVQFYKVNVFTEGIHILLDHTGVPIFINEINATGNARVADLSTHPDTNMSGLACLPLRIMSYNGVQNKCTDWANFMRESFNPPTRALCDSLAQATPRALAADEALSVVHAWTNASTSTTALWGEHGNKGACTGQTFNLSNTSHLSLAMWAQYASALWSQEKPTEHAVLAVLLPGMDSLEKIEQWRLQMRAMSVQAQPELHASYSVAGLTEMERGA